MSSTSTPREKPLEQPNSLAYTRRLFAKVFEWYSSAEKKAQILLTLNGALLGFVGSAAFWNTDKLKVALPQIGYETLLFFIAFLLALAASVLCALMSIRSRLRHLPASVKLPPTPANLWFFQLLPSIQPDTFRTALKDVDADREIDILSSQIQVLSYNVINKHLWFNRGYAFVVAGLLCFFVVVATYFVRLYAGIAERFSWPLLFGSLAFVAAALVIYRGLTMIERKREKVFQAQFPADE